MYTINQTTVLGAHITAVRTTIEEALSFMGLDEESFLFEFECKISELIPFKKYTSIWDDLDVMFTPEDR